MPPDPPSFQGLLFFVTGTHAYKTQSLTRSSTHLGVLFPGACLRPALGRRGRRACPGASTPTAPRTTFTGPLPPRPPPSRPTPLTPPTLPTTRPSCSTTPSSPLPPSGLLLWLRRVLFFFWFFFSPAFLHRRGSSVCDCF